MNWKNNKKGFTLVEMLVYISIFILVSGAAIGLLFSLNDLFVQYKLKQNLLSTGTTVMERLLIEVREADSVIVADSTLSSTTAGVLVLDKGTNTVKIIKNGNQLDIYEDNIFSSHLNDSDVEVTGATFYHYIKDGKELVRFRLDLRSVSGSQSEDWTITSGAIIRGSYANI